MFYRDASLAMWHANCQYYVDLVIKDQSTNTTIKTILSDTFTYVKNTSQNFDTLLEQYAIAANNLGK